MLQYTLVVLMSIFFLDYRIDSKVRKYFSDIKKNRWRS